MHHCTWLDRYFTDTRSGCLPKGTLKVTTAIGHYVEDRGPGKGIKKGDKAGNPITLPGPGKSRVVLTPKKPLRVKVNGGQ